MALWRMAFFSILAFYEWGRATQVLTPLGQLEIEFDILDTRVGKRAVGSLINTSSGYNLSTVGWVE
jgi:hypothetical protein